MTYIPVTITGGRQVIIHLDTILGIPHGHIMRGTTTHGTIAGAGVAGTDLGITAVGAGTGAGAAGIPVGMVAGTAAAGMVVDIIITTIIAEATMAIEALTVDIMVPITDLVGHHMVLRDLHMEVQDVATVEYPLAHRTIPVEVLA